MTGLSDPLDLTALLAEQDFVRRLARGLLFDEHRVDDVVQQTWLAALRNPPQDRGALRGWLKQVVRNIASNELRGNARRARREREIASAAQGASVAADEVLAREEERRLVVGALGELDEPYRSTLVLRYLEDLTPAQIARRVGVPGATVRTRLRRGLEQLRVSLDRRHGGDRRAWCLALVGLAVPRRPAGLVGLLSVRATSWLAMGWIVKAWIGMGAVAMAALLGWLWLGLDGDAAATAAPPAVDTTHAAQADVAPAAQPESAAERADLVTAEPTGAAAWVAPVAELRGRVLGHDQRPVAELGVELVGLDSVSLFAGEGPRRGLDLAHAQTSTGADGRFVLRGVRPRGVYALRLGGATSAPSLHLLARTPAAGESVDLGDLWLALRGTLRGRVVDADGAPAVGAEIWSVDGIGGLRGLLPLERLDPARGAILALPAWQSDEPHQEFGHRLREYLAADLFQEELDADDPAYVLSAVDDPGWAAALLGLLPIARTRTAADGSFVLEGVEPGSTMLVAVAAGHPALVRQTTLPAGGDRDLGTLQLAVGDALRGTVRDVDGASLANAEVRVAPLGRARFRGIAFCSATTRCDQDGRFTLPGLPRGDVLVAVRRGADQAWVCSGPFDSDASVEIALPSTTRFDLDVRDPDGQPIEGASLRVLVGPILGELERAGLQRELPLAAAVRLPDGGYRIAALEPGTYTVEATAEGYCQAVASVSLPANAPLQMVLQPSRAFEVVVRDSRGAPVHGARVFARSEPAPAWTRNVMPTSYGLPSWDQLPLPAGRTDADGRLQVTLAPAGRVLLAVDHPEHGQGEAALDTAQVARTEVTLLGTGDVDGLLYDGGRPAQASEWLVRLERVGSDTTAAGMPWRQALATPDRAGQFRLSGLSPGVYRATARRALPQPASVASLVGLISEAVSWSFESYPSSEVEVVAGRTATLRFDVDPALPKPGELPGRVRGVVRLDGVPLADVEIVKGAFWQQKQLARTDARGAWVVDRIVSGRHELTLLQHAEPLWTGALRVEPGGDHRLDLDLHLEPVRGMATLVDGSALPQHRVHAQGVVEGAGGTFHANADVSADGSFELRLPPGTFNLSVYGPDAKGELRGLTVATGTTAPVRVVLDHVLVVAGQVLGVPPGARILFASKHSTHLSLLSDDGRFHVPDIAPLLYDVTVTVGAKTYATEPTQVDLRHGDQRDLVLRLGQRQD